MQIVEDLLDDFRALMQDVMQHGWNKHGELSFQGRAMVGNFERTERMQKGELVRHAHAHTIEYLIGVPHDHFHDVEHQLAAAACNLMIEYFFLRRENRRPGMCDYREGNQTCSLLKGHAGIHRRITNDQAKG